LEGELAQSQSEYRTEQIMLESAQDYVGALQKQLSELEIKHREQTEELKSTQECVGDLQNQLSELETKRQVSTDKLNVTYPLLEHAEEVCDQRDLISCLARRIDEANDEVQAMRDEKVCFPVQSTRESVTDPTP
jgi:chromosome segregation ATPase